MSEENLDNSYLEEKLPLRNKLAFAAIAFTSGIFSGLVLTTGFTQFYVEKFNVSATLTTLAWAIFIIWNTINDPLIGFYQERTGSEEHGRRAPYLRYGAPIYAGLFILSWFPFIPGEIGIFINMVLILFFFDTIFTTVGLISYSLPAEMTVSEHARSDLMVYGSIASALALMFSFILPQLLNSKHYTQDPGFPLFRLIMIIIGIIGGIILFVSSYYIKENKYSVLEEPLGFKDSFVETIKNKSFLIFEGANFIYLIAQFILTQGISFYLQYGLGLRSSVIRMLLLAMFFLVVFVSLPVHSRIVDKLGVKKTFVFILSFLAISFYIGFFGLAWYFSLAIIFLILIGFGFSGFFLTNQMVMADIIDYDEIRTGKRRETSYSGMNALFTKPANSIGPIVLLSILTFFGYSAGVSLYSPVAVLADVKFGVILAFTLVPAILISIAAVIINFFPLEGDKWREKKKKLHKTHKQKEKEFIDHLKESGKL